MGPLRNLMYCSLFMSIFIFNFLAWKKICTGIFLSVCMSVHHMCAQCLQRPEEGIEFPGTAGVYSCEPPGERWEQNLSHLYKQQVLLTAEHIDFLQRQVSPSAWGFSSLVSIKMYSFQGSLYPVNQGLKIPSSLSVSGGISHCYGVHSEPVSIVDIQELQLSIRFF